MKRAHQANKQQYADYRRKKKRKKREKKRTATSDIKDRGVEDARTPSSERGRREQQRFQPVRQGSSLASLALPSQKEGMGCGGPEGREKGGELAKQQPIEAELDSPIVFNTPSSLILGTSTNNKFDSIDLNPVGGGSRERQGNRPIGQKVERDVTRRDRTRAVLQQQQQLQEEVEEVDESNKGKIGSAAGKQEEQCSNIREKASGPGAAIVKEGVVIKSTATTLEKRREEGGKRLPSVWRHTSRANEGQVGGRQVPVRSEIPNEKSTVRYQLVELSRSQSFPCPDAPLSLLRTGK